MQIETFTEVFCFEDVSPEKKDSSNLMCVSSDFHYMIIMAKRVHNNDIMISIEILKEKKKNQFSFLNITIVNTCILRHPYFKCMIFI